MSATAGNSIVAILWDSSCLDKSTTILFVDAITWVIEEALVSLRSRGGGQGFKDDLHWAIAVKEACVNELASRLIISIDFEVVGSKCRCTLCKRRGTSVGNKCLKDSIGGSLEDGFIDGDLDDAVLPVGNGLSGGCAECVNIDESVLSLEIVDLEGGDL